MIIYRKNKPFYNGGMKMEFNEILGNEETKKIIIEKIEELHKEVDGKIDNRKKTLDDKIREIDETVHGKKK